MVLSRIFENDLVTVVRLWSTPEASTTYAAYTKILDELRKHVPNDATITRTSSDRGRTPWYMYLETFKHGLEEEIYSLLTPFGQVRFFPTDGNTRARASPSFLKDMDWSIIEVTGEIESFTFFQDTHKYKQSSLWHEPWGGSGGQSCFYLIQRVEDIELCKQGSRQRLLAFGLLHITECQREEDKKLADVGKD